jgi:hypothetical protein
MGYKRKWRFRTRQSQAVRQKPYQFQYLVKRVFEPIFSPGKQSQTCFFFLICYNVLVHKCVQI